MLQQKLLLINWQSSYYRSFNLPVKIVRPFNTYGPRQSARAIITTIIIQILNSQESIKIGSYDTLRDFTFVKNVVSGILKIAESDRLFGEITNIGMNEEINIGDLAKQISELMNIKIEIITEKERVRPDKSEVKRLLCDNSKIKELTGWRPRCDLKTGLIETIEWFRINRKEYKPEIYNI